MLCCAVLCLVTQLCPTLCYSVDCSWPGSSVHGDSPGKNTGVDCHALLQGIFPTQGLNPGLLLCRRTLYHLSHQGGPIYNRICMYDVCIHVLYMYYTHIIHTHSIYTHPIGSFCLEISNMNIIILFYKWNWGIKIPTAIPLILSLDLWLGHTTDISMMFLSLSCLFLEEEERREMLMEEC